jgi:hypothetical protein
MDSGTIWRLADFTRTRLRSILGRPKPLAPETIQLLDHYQRLERPDPSPGIWYPRRKHRAPRCPPAWTASSPPY